MIRGTEARLAAIRPSAPALAVWVCATSNCPRASKTFSAWSARRSLRGSMGIRNAGSTITSRPAAAA